MVVPGTSGGGSLPCTKAHRPTCTTTTARHCATADRRWAAASHRARSTRTQHARPHKLRAWPRSSLPSMGNHDEPQSSTKTHTIMCLPTLLPPPHVTTAWCRRGRRAPIRNMSCQARAEAEATVVHAA